MTVAFYAPMKPPDHPVPSGDRTVARGLVAALERAGLGAVALASRFGSRDGRGEEGMQEGLIAEAELEAERIARELARPKLWLTYHSYYKAPDLLGPALARRWGIPYVLVEATRATKRLDGPYARFAQAAEAACDAADLILFLTEHDREALEAARPPRQRLARLRPFLATEALPPPPGRPAHAGLALLACAMFRPGDKMASFSALAAALAKLELPGWTLEIAGDGPMRREVEALFAPLGERVALTGALGPEALAQAYARADLLVWPGVGEAFGMAYLEAQARGCPVLAEDRPGVRDVVRAGGLLTPAGDAGAFAAAIARVAGDPALRAELGARGRAQVESDHLLPAAVRTLREALAPLLAERA